MKFTVCTIDRQEEEHETTITIRATAHHDTICRKCALAILEKLQDEWHREPITANYLYERPNVWTNGGVGSAALTIDGWTLPLFIQREDGAIYAN